MSGSFRRSTGAAVLAVAVAALVTAAATASPSGRQTKSDDSITVAVPNPIVNYAQVFIAKAAGLFDKYGVNVTLKEATGANTLNTIVTGEADVTPLSTTQGLQLAAQGKQVSSIYIYSRDPGSWLFGAPGITSIDQAKALGDKCKILGGTVGNQSYGYALIYKDTAKLGLSQCSTDGTPSTATLIARMAAGQATLASGPYSAAKLAVDAYGAKILINPNLPGYRKQYNLPNFVAGTWWGLKDNLQAKRPAVVKFVRALDAAAALMLPKNLNQLTKYLQPFSSFNTIAFNDLRNQLQNTIRYIGAGANQATLAQIKAKPNALTSDPGWITQAAWAESLKQYTKWGVPGLDVTASYASYGAAVDMSYLTEALKSKK
jgi:ABC-type nitrate/sulfonate/bicarbonate transport system substrate-binding protein